MTRAAALGEALRGAPCVGARDGGAATTVLVAPQPVLDTAIVGVAIRWQLVTSECVRFRRPILTRDEDWLSSLTRGDTTVLSTGCPL